MDKYLAILEVSQKQAYIFSSKELKSNALRSAEIGYVTSSAFFTDAAPAQYQPEENLVYCGGGHGVLQFSDRKAATDCVAAITQKAMQQFPGMELFAKVMEYDAGKTPGENLIALSRQLEEKKALRSSSFFALPTGLEAQDPAHFRPVRLDLPQESAVEARLLPPPDGYVFPTKFEDLAGDDNFLAVVHLDGNAMGTRVSRIYQDAGHSWDICRRNLQAFSEGIQKDFEAAFSKTVETLLGIIGETLQRRDQDGRVILPIRPIILAGDDVCFVTTGDYALECARIFLEHLAGMSNAQDHLPYAACGGVALVHRKYPFHQAYMLSEALCSNAKKFGAALDAQGRLSVLDWHIAFGQLRENLAAIREDYATEDGNRMELRPVLAVVPNGVPVSEEVLAFRHYDWFRVLCEKLQKDTGRIGRGKLKNLRTAMKQGTIECSYYLQNRQILSILDHAFDARYRSADTRMEKLRQMYQDNENMARSMFWTDETASSPIKRCLFFDAVEMIDHWKPLKGGST